MPGELSVSNDSELTVTGSLATQGGMTLGGEAKLLPFSGEGTLTLDGASKDTARLDIGGSVVIGTDGGATMGEADQAGTLNLKKGIATISGDLAIGGTSGNVPYIGTPNGIGGKGELFVGKDAELHMNAGASVKMGGDGSSAWNDPIAGVPIPGLPGGNSDVESFGVMNLGTVTMGGNGGSGSDALLVVPGMPGLNGGHATLTLHAGSVTTMGGLTAGGSGGDGGSGSDGSNPGNAPLIGQGGIGGFGGNAIIDVKGSLTITGETNIGGSHGADGQDGLAVGVAPAPVIPGGWYGFGGMAGKAQMTVADGGELTLGSKVTINSNADLPDFTTDPRDIAKQLIWLAAAHSYIKISEGGTLHLTEGQNRDLVFATDDALRLNSGFDASGLISDNSSGTILFNGGTVKGKNLSASEGLTLGQGKGEVHAQIITDKFTLGAYGDAQDLEIKNGTSLTITGTSDYLVTDADSKVTLNGGKLSVGGDIALNGGTAVLIGSNLGGKNHDVTLTAGAANHLVTQGTAFAGDAPVKIENGSSLTAKVLDTTTKGDGTHVAGGQNVNVGSSNGKGALYLTQNVNQGTALKLGTDGNLHITNGTLGLTGNVTMGKLSSNDQNVSTTESLTGVQKGNGSITFGIENTLEVDGLLGYEGNLTVAHNATGDDIFGGNIKANGISTSSMKLVGNGSSVQLLGFANAGQNFLSGNVSVENTSVLTLGGVEGRGGSSSATIALKDTAKLVLKQGNFSTGAITVTDAGSSLNIGDNTEIGNKGSLQANVDMQHGSLVVNNTSADGAYTIKGTVKVDNDATITMTKGALNIDGVLDYITSNNLLIAGQSLAVKTLNLVAQTVSTGTGTLSVADLNSTGAAKIDATGGTLDLGAQNIADLSKMGASTAEGVVDGYKGTFTINDSIVKTTGTANYTNDTALTLHKQGGASTATAFNGALQAGMLVAKTSAGVAQDVNVSGDSLTLYGTGTGFLDVATLKVNNGGSVQLGSKDYALGGSSASKVELAGGSMNVKGGMFTFTGDKTLSTSGSAGNVNVNDGGVLAFTQQAVADGLGQNISFNVGSGLQSDATASAGTLLLASTAGLNQNGKVNIDLKKGAVVMGGSGTLADLGWINETLTKWGVSSPAILAISGKNTIDLTGSVLKVGSDGQNHFGDNSLTVVDVTGFTKDNAALKVDGAAASFGKDARLLLTGKLVDGNQHTILQSAAGYASSSIDDTWSVVRNPSRLVNITTSFDTTGKDIIADVAVVSPTSAMPGLSNSLGALMQDMARNPNLGFDVQSNNAGVRFLSRVAHEDYMADGKAAAATAEGAAQLAAVGNVVGTTLGASNSAALNTGTRMSFTANKVDASKSVALHKDTDGSLSVDSGLSAGDGLKNGLGLWLMPMYQHNNTWGLKAGEFKTGSTTDLFGISLGADYTIMDSLRFGLALNLGGGNSRSNGDFNTTDTRSNFWGLSLYSGWMKDNFGLSADIGYTRNFSAMDQELPQSMGMSSLKADVNSDAWTAGLRAEYKFATSALDLIPHVGVRYTGIRSEDYKAKSGGETVFRVEESFQSLWTIPVGVTLSKQFDTASGWSFTPKVDLGIVAAAGDLDSKSRTRIPGLNTTAEMETQVVDALSFDGGLGFEVKNDNIAFGLNYNIQASEHRTGHGLFGTVRYEF